MFLSLHFTLQYKSYNRRRFYHCVLPDRTVFSSYESCTTSWAFCGGEAQAEAQAEREEKRIQNIRIEPLSCELFRVSSFLLQKYLNSSYEGWSCFQPRRTDLRTFTSASRFSFPLFFFESGILGLSFKFLAVWSCVVPKKKTATATTKIGTSECQVDESNEWASDTCFLGECESGSPNSRSIPSYNQQRRFFGERRKGNPTAFTTFHFLLILLLLLHVKSKPAAQLLVFIFCFSLLTCILPSRTEERET